MFKQQNVAYHSFNNQLIVKGKGKGKFQPRTGHGGARWGWVVDGTPRPLYPGKDPVLIVQEAGWVPGPF